MAARLASGDQLHMRPEHATEAHRANSSSSMAAACHGRVLPQFQFFKLMRAVSTAGRGWHHAPGLRYFRSLSPMPKIALPPAATPADVPGEVRLQILSH